VNWSLMDPLGKVPGGSSLVGLACAQRGPVVMARDARGHRGGVFRLNLQRGQLARNTYRQVPEVYTFTYVKGELYKVDCMFYMYVTARATASA